MYMTLSHLLRAAVVNASNDIGHSQLPLLLLFDEDQHTDWIFSKTGDDAEQIMCLLHHTPHGCMYSVMIAATLALASLPLALRGCYFQEDSVGRQEYRLALTYLSQPILQPLDISLPLCRLLLFQTNVGHIAAYTRGTGFVLTPALLALASQLPAS